MAARSSWKGYLKLSLISVPVKAYTATTSGGGEIHLNQLHEECKSRIQYKKTCPLHGEVPNDAIVSGYEYAKGQYVIVDPEELDKLRSEADKAVKIEAFVAPDTLDPMYYSGKTYYLIPDGPVAQKPYVVLLQGMQEEQRYAFAQVVMHGREQMVLLRPIDGLLAMSILSYDAQLTKPVAFSEEAPKAEVAPEELKLIKALIEAQTPEKFDYAQYKDKYTENLSKLIEAKVAGKELVAPPAQEPVQVINLMEALKQSVENAQKAAPKKEAAQAKPPKKMAPSAKPKAEVRKRKSS